MSVSIHVEQEVGRLGMSSALLLAWSEPLQSFWGGRFQLLANFCACSLLIRVLRVLRASGFRALLKGYNLRHCDTIALYKAT
jgi:hypothetical protein